MASDELFKPLDVLVDAGFFSNSGESPRPADSFKTVHGHQEGVWILLSLVLFDKGLGARIDGEYSFILLGTHSGVDASCIAVKCRR